MGTAYVAIRAVADKLKGDIETALKGSNDAAKNAGAEAGKNFQDGFKQNQGDLAPDLSNVIGKAGAAGDSAGQQFNSSLKAATSRGDSIDVSNMTRGAESALREEGERAGNAFKEGAAQVDMGGAGEGMGRSLGDGFSRGMEGGGATTALSGIGGRMIALVPLIAMLLGSLSALASGFFAMASAIGPAAGTLAVLPGLFIAAASAAGLLKAAFGGIGGALKAGLAEQATGGAAAAASSKALAAASRAVESAQRGMTDAVRSNARALADANRAIQDAVRNVANTYADGLAQMERADRSLFLSERGLMDALERQAESQVRLTEARKDARDEIIELQFALEDSVIGQERAAINLERARRQLQLMSGLPPDNLLRKEAELAYKEAELAVRKTAHTFDEASEAATAATKAGVDDSEAMKDARKEEEDAARAVADAQYALIQQRKEHGRTEKRIAEQNMLAQRGLADAYKRRDQTIQDNARRSADAQRALNDAMRNVADAAKAASPAMSAYGQAMAKLTPAQQDFVKYLKSIAGEWKALKATVAENILGPAKGALQEFMEGGLFKMFSDGMDGASKSVGNFFTRLEETMKSPIFKGNFKTVMDSNVVVVDKLGLVLNNIVRIFFAVAAAAAPMTERFATWIGLVTGNWADKAEGSGKRMEVFFKKAGDVAAQLGRIIGNITEGIFDLGKTAAPAGQSLLDSFEKATEKFSNLVADDEDKKRFKKYFDDVAINVKKIGDLVVTIGREFAKLGDDQGIGDTAVILEGLVVDLGELFKTLNNLGGPAIAKFLTSISDMIKALGKSPALEIFIGTLTALADAITWVVSTPVGGAFLIFLGTLIGITKSIALVKKVLFIDQIISGLGKMDKFIQGKTGSRLSSLFGKVGDDAEKASKRVDKAFDGSKPGKPGKGGNTPDGVDKDTKRAGEAFGDNLKDLRKQFKKTGDAKDAFILNLQKLSGQFARTGAAATGTAGKAAGTAAAGAGVGAGASELLDDADIDRTSKNADKLDKSTDKAGKSGGKLSKAFGPLKGLLGGLSLGLLGVSSAAVAAAAPFIIAAAVIGAIVLVFVGAWKHSERLRDAFENKLKPALEKLYTALKPAIDAFKEMVEKGLKKLGDFIADVLLPVLIKLIEWLAEHIPPVVEFFVGVFDWISEHWGLIGKILMGPLNFFIGLLPAIFSGIQDAFGAAKDWIVEKWEALTTFFSELPGKIGAFFTGIWDGFTGGLQTAADWVTTKWEEIITWLSEVPGRIGAFFVGIWNGLVAGLQEAKNWIFGKFEELAAFVASIPGRLAAAAGNLWGWLTSALVSASVAVNTKLNAIVTFVKNLPGKIAGVGSKLWSFLSSGIDTAKNWVTTQLNSILTTIGGMPGKIGNATRNMWDGIKNSFRNALNYIIDRWNGLSFRVGGMSGFGITIPSFTLNTPNIDRLALGGTVPATPGGRLALIGEGGRDERVTPLNQSGMSPAEERMIEMLEMMQRDNSGQQERVQIIVNPPPGTDVQTLARLVSLELGFQRAR